MSEDKRRNLLEIVAAKQLSNSAVARITGKSASTVSQVLNGKYQGRPEVLDEMVAALDSFEENSEPAQLDGTVQWLTDGEKLINGMLTLTYQTCGFAALVGPSGIGKTYTSKLFAEHHQQDTAYIRCADGMCQGDVVNMLLDIVGLPAYGTKTQRMKRAITAMKESGIRMILVDEADLLVTDGSKPAILRKISVFREIKESGIGVAMIGLESFDNALRLVGETYVTSRLDYFRRVKDTAAEELAYFVAKLGIDPETPEARHAISLAPKRGSLRLISKFAQTANLIGLREALAVIFNATGHIKEV
ncbi:MAG: AAA family ATPase [Cloacibacillus sp.]